MKTGVVTIDFSVLEKQIDTVKLPANVIKQIADAVKDPSNDAESLSIVLTDGTSIEFDEKALSKKTAQTNQTDITISIKRTTDSALNALQRNGHPHHTEHHGAQEYHHHSKVYQSRGCQQT